MVDALALGASGSNPVRVRVSPWAPHYEYIARICGSNVLSLYNLEFTILSLKSGVGGR